MLTILKPAPRAKVEGPVSPVHHPVDLSVNVLCEATCALLSAEKVLRVSKPSSHEAGAKHLRTVLKKLNAIVPILHVAAYEAENLAKGRRLALPAPKGKKSVAIEQGKSTPALAA